MLFIDHKLKQPSFLVLIDSVLFNRVLSDLGVKFRALKFLFVSKETGRQSNRILLCLRSALLEVITLKYYCGLKVLLLKMMFFVSHNKNQNNLRLNFTFSHYTGEDALMYIEFYNLSDHKYTGSRSYARNHLFNLKGRELSIHT